MLLSGATVASGVVLSSGVVVCGVVESSVGGTAVVVVTSGVVVF